MKVTKNKSLSVGKSNLYYQRSSLKSCLASIMDMPIEYMINIENISEGHWPIPLYCWIASEGFIITEYHNKILEGYYIAFGKSEFGNNHCVVMYNNKMVFDPTPSGLGLKNIDYCWRITRKSFVQLLSELTSETEKYA